MPPIELRAVDFAAIAPLLILTGVSLALLFARRDAPQQAQALTLAGLLLALSSLPLLPQGGPFLGGAIDLDGIALAFMAVFLIVSALVVLSTPGGLLGIERPREFYFLIVLSTVGMLATAIAAELITLFVGFELASLATYALVAWTRREARALEAAVKFFIIGALSSAIALYGLSLLYGATGTTSLTGLQAAIPQAAAEMGWVVRLGMVLLLAGFGFKITAVPFHLWAPDVYEGAPTPVTAILAAGSKKMGFAVLFKLFLIALIALKASWVPLLGLMAVLTMTVGNLSALLQTSVKRMLAYSSIAHAGYILIALPVATGYALAGGLFQILTHAVATAGAFLVLAAVASWGLGEGFEGMSGLGRRRPLLAGAMALFMLSLVGIPPFVGFQSKFVLFSAAVEGGLAGNSWLLGLAVAGVLNSALSLYYYARVLKAMYVEAPVEAAAGASNPGHFSVPWGLSLAVVLAAAFIVLGGLLPGPLIAWLWEAAAALF
jgi:NADH-quinone oxidoreductase subunit N